MLDGVRCILVMNITFHCCHLPSVRVSGVGSQQDLTCLTDLPSLFATFPSVSYVIWNYV